jgi:thymidylate kinase
MNKYTPQWLKEVLVRGYKPAKIYQNFDNSLFCYIDSNSVIERKAPKSRSFVLEGLPGAGKTTLLERFDKHKTIQTIQQILPFEPINDQAMDASFYISSEQLKANEIANSSKNFCLLDRYYVSTLAFYWAKDQIDKTNKYADVFNWYKQAMLKHDIWQPFMVFYIDVDPTLSVERKNRTNNEEIKNLWGDKIFLKYFSEYYEYFYNNIEPRTNVCYISGNLSLDEVEKIIKKAIYEK